MCASSAPDVPTEEMIRAGMRVVQNFVDDAGDGTASWVAEGVYEAMMEVAPQRQSGQSTRRPRAVQGARTGA